MKYSALIISLLLSFLASGQTSLDSFYAHWLGIENAEPLVKLALYNYGNDGFFQSDPDSASQFYHAIIDFGKNTNNPSAEIRGHLLLSQLYLSQRAFDSCLDQISTASIISEATGDKKHQAYCLYLKGLTFRDQELHEASLDYLQKSLQIDEEIGNQEGIIWSITRMAQIYVQIGRYDEALDFFYRGLEYDLPTGNKRWLGSDYYHIGQVYYLRGQNQLALQNLQESLRLREEIDYKAGIANCLNDIGAIYLDQKNYEQALNYYKRALRTREEMDTPASQNIGPLLNNIGLVYLHQNQFNQAHDYFTRCLQVSEERGDNRVKALALFGLGNILKNEERFDSGFGVLKPKPRNPSKKGRSGKVFHLF